MTRPDNDYRLPVGDVIMYGVYFNPKLTPQYKYEPTPNYHHIAESQLWWTPPDNVEKIRDIADTFLGFSFHIGQPYSGSTTVPEVIDDDMQERKAGNMWTTSTKGVQALIDDVMVWLEIDDVDVARETLINMSNIPCAVRCDIIRYSSDVKYRETFDLANDYFMYYCQNDKPIKLGVVKMDDKDLLRKMYDL